MRIFLRAIALRLVPCAHKQDAGEFAVRSGGRLQRDGVHAGDFDQAALQQVDDFENALRERVGAVGMGLGEPFDAGDGLVDARVVLHGAGAERIHAEIDGVVPGREAREVADDFDFAQLGQQAGGFAMRGAEQGRGIDSGHVERRQLVGALAGRGFLEDERFVLRLVGADFAGCASVFSVPSFLYLPRG